MVTSTGRRDIIIDLAGRLRQLRKNPCSRVAAPVRCGTAVMTKLHTTIACRPEPF